MTAVAGLPLSLDGSVSEQGCTVQPAVVWSFGDGATSSETTPIHTYALPGEMPWTFTATAASASCTSTGTLHVGAAPPVPSLFVPAVAHSPGAEGTSWRSDLVIVNLAGQEVDLSMGFSPQDGGPEVVESTRLQSGTSVEWEDVLVSLFGFADDAATKGTLRVDATAVLHVYARTYNLSSLGTYGQFIPARTRGDCLGSGDVGLVAQLRSAPGFRSNVGLLNTSSVDCEVDVSLHGRNGGAIGSSQEWVVPAAGYWQRNDVFSAFGAGDRDLAWLSVSPQTEGCALWAYGSVVDNLSSDPTTIPILFDLETGVSTLAAVAHAPGVGGTTWRTDLGAVNPGGRPVSAELSFQPYGGDRPSIRTQVIGAGETVLWADVLVSLFDLSPEAVDKGAVRVDADGPLAVSARTYNETLDGTYGQYMPAVAGGGALRPPSVGVVAGLKKTGRYRSNLGVLNPGITDVNLLIRLFDASGGQIGSTLTRTVSAAAYVQENDLFVAVGAAAEPLAYAAVQVISPGSAVWVYGSVVDNDSGDPTTVPVIDSSTIGAATDLSGRYETVIGPAPGFVVEVDHDGSTVNLVIRGKNIELTGEGQLEGRLASITSWLSADLQLAFELEFARNGQGFAGTWRSVVGPPIDGTITGSRTPLAAWNVADGPLPVVVEHAGVNLDVIERISRFRSGAGHDFSDDFEDCRSMKHYYQAWPELDPSVVVVYAPFDGTVIGHTDEFDDEGLWKGTAIGMRSAAYPAFSMTYFHIDLDTPLEIGDVVRGGQRLGVSAKTSGTSTDFALRVVTPHGHALISYFQVMPDDVFAALEARGVESRDALVIFRAERDADPLTCIGEEFADEGNLENWVRLTRP